MDPYLSGIQSITLPSVDSSVLKYQFTYNSTPTDGGRGELKSMTTPYGTTVTYGYQYNRFANPIMSSVDGMLLNPVTSKIIQYTDSLGQARSEAWTYGGWIGSSGATKQVTNPDGSSRTYVAADLKGDWTTGVMGHDLSP